jgi:hypothetical protein
MSSLTTALDDNISDIQNGNADDNTRSTLGGNPDETQIDNSRWHTR